MGFEGNQEDLDQFRRLADTRIRSPEREAAMREWEGYKLRRQLAVANRRDPKRAGSKGHYVRALTQRAIDLRGASLDGICVGYADLRGVNFDGCSMRGAWLKGAKLANASMVGADLSAAGDGTNNRGPARLLYADLTGANLRGAILAGVDLSYASLNDADLSDVDLSGANLTRSTLVRVNLEGALLVATKIYGIAAWDLQGEPALQQNLVITADGDPPIDVDDLRVAQFIYLLLTNPAIRKIIDTVTTRMVLILGRFTPERKSALEVVRRKLRELGLVPVMFDFTPSERRDLTETITVLASMARLIVADLTDAAAVREELPAIVPNFPSLPIQPILLDSAEPYSMHGHWTKFPWVLPLMRYRDEAQLAALVAEKILPAMHAWENQPRAD